VRRQKKAKEEARHDNKCKSKMTAFTGIVQPQTEDGMLCEKIKHSTCDLELFFKMNSSFSSCGDAKFGQ
jgi:hypothetical protein